MSPPGSDSHAELGDLLASLGRLAEAERHYRRALELAPHRPELHGALALLLERQGRFSEAEDCHRRALTLAPERAEAHATLADLLAALRRGEEAEALYRRALELAPDNPVTLSNLGVLLADLRRDDDAEDCLRRAIAQAPERGESHRNLALLLLARGRHEEGWRYHEARTPPAPPFSTAPRWQGENVAGRTLLVWPEQGLGDALQFCRYLPRLKERGARRVILVCHAPLAPLLDGLPGVDALLTPEDAAVAPPPHDYWIPLLSLPARFPLSDTLPYLRPTAERTAAWAKHLPPTGPRVGLVWKGNPRHDNDPHRSLPSLAALRPLWSVPDVHFVSLQRGQGEEEGLHPPADQPLLHLGSAVRDFADTAAIVSMLDLVISVDTAVAHLAGALGKPCWVLLPTYRVDWRWGQTGETTPWYPGVMRLFRQGAGEDWEPPVAALRSALAAHFVRPA